MDAGGGCGGGGGIGLLKAALGNFQSNPRTFWRRRGAGAATGTKRRRLAERGVSARGQCSDGGMESGRVEGLARGGSLICVGYRDSIHERRGEEVGCFLRDRQGYGTAFDGKSSMASTDTTRQLSGPESFLRLCMALHSWVTTAAYAPRLLLCPGLVQQETQLVSALQKRFSGCRAGRDW